MVAWLSASKSVQSMATTMELRAPITNAPSEPDIIDNEGGIGQKPIHLLDGMPRLQTSGDGEALADRTDSERAAVQYSQSGVADRVDTFGVKVLFQQAAKYVTNCLV